MGKKIHCVKIHLDQTRHLEILIEILQFALVILSVMLWIINDHGLLKNCVTFCSEWPSNKKIADTSAPKPVDNKWFYGSLQIKNFVNSAIISRLREFSKTCANFQQKIHIHRQKKLPRSESTWPPKGWGKQKIGKVQLFASQMYFYGKL